MAKSHKSPFTPKLPEPKEAAAAVALTGAAALGGKLTLDKVSAGQRADARV
jgi:hypothetical protein